LDIHLLRGISLPITPYQMVSNQSIVFECILDDGMLHIVKHLLHIVLVRGARNVGVQLLRVPLTQFDLTDILLFDIFRSFLVGVVAVILWKAHRQRFMFDFLLEQIRFIQKQDERGGSEVAGIGHDIEQLEGFRHRIQLILFIQILIVTRQRRHKQDTVHRVEAMNPFVPLRSLSADIIDVEHCVFDREGLIPHSCSGYSGQQNVLFCGPILGVIYPIHIIEEVRGGIGDS